MSHSTATSSSQKPELNLILAAQVNPDDATPMVRQFVEVKREYPGIILFYRTGDFYETFFEDAVITARALEITLTSREAGKLGRIPMAGVPVKAVDGYLGKLIEKNFKVAICEQMEDPALAKGLVERRVTRVISSGTVTDQRFVPGGDNHYLAAVVQNPKSQEWGLAYVDVTTGAFRVTQLASAALWDELERISPKELLVLGRRHKGPVVDEWLPDVQPALVERFACTPLKSTLFDEKACRTRIERWFALSSLQSFGLEDAPLATTAAGLILAYIEATYIEDNRPVFGRIERYHRGDALVMPGATRRHLELTQTVRDGRQDGSLLSVLDKTLTPMGGRLLKRWIHSPSINLTEIEARLDAVSALIARPDIRERLEDVLPRVCDLERLGMKVQNLSAMPRDLTALNQACLSLPQVVDCLASLVTPYFEGLSQLPESVSQFSSRVSGSLLEQPAITLKEGQLFQDGFHPELARLRGLLANQNSWLAEYEANEREKTGIKTLKVGVNNAFGFYIEISKGQAGSAPAHYHRKQTLTNAERYTTPELKAHEEQVFTAQDKLFALEYDLFLQLRESLQPYGEVLKIVAEQVAALDVLLAFSHVAVERHYVRPHLDDSQELILEEARHPVIEALLPVGRFVANDCALSAAPRDHRLPQLVIITGPNMAGKSTYMRQVALCVIMAQMGCYVPARYMRLGLVDQIFTRIGAVDDLSTGQSTFMVEMTETAQILNGATPRSLVLLDEVGRGTSTYDGVAIAWAVSEYIVGHNGCRTLFATHYHELNTLEQLSPKIQNVRVLVSETDGQIELLHKVAPGAAQKSYGIHVAQMAGLPPKVVQKAELLLNRMQEKELAVIDKKRQTSLLAAAKDDQLSLFATESL